MTGSIRSPAKAVVAWKDDGMIRSRVVVMMALLSLAAPVSAGWAESIYVEGKSARIRSGPGTNYQILWEAPRYTPLEYLAKYKQWYAVRDYEGDVGWVHQQVIGKGKAAIVTNKKANVRKGPGPSYPIVFTVEKLYRFKVMEEKGDWYKVKDAEGDEGWIFKTLVWVSR